VRRCRLRIVRRGGWAWGARPGQWLHAAIAAIPELIAEELEALFPEPMPHLVIAGPVQIRVSLRGEKRIAVTAAGAPEMRNRLLPELRAQIAKALGGVVESLSPHKEEAVASQTDEKRPTVGVPSEPALHWLAQTARAGELAPLLRLLPESALAQWAACVFEELSAAQAIEGSAQRSEWRELFEQIRDEFGPLPSSRRGRLQRLLFAAGRFTAHAGITAWSSATQRLLLDAFPVELDEETHARATTDIASESATPAATTRPAQRKHAVLPRPAKRTEVALPCALPFLLLNPLADAGYWPALHAALDVASLRDEAALFAASLAFKVLAPPKRGWRRDETVAIAAAFAGLDRLDEKELSGFARRFAHATPLLDAAIVRAFVKAFRANDPLLLCAVDDGWLLAETDCAAPIAFAETLDGVISALRQFPSPFVMAADSQALHRLDDEGFAFVDLVRPRDAKSRIVAHRFAELPARVLEAWDAIATQRPSVPLSSDPALDRTLSIAASAAMSTIAWKLWHARESCDALLTFERFADFSAIVQFGEDAVRVRFPLGRRFFDLREHGLADSVSALPWLPGRDVIFTGG
jgi:hypothetical protein